MFDTIILIFSVLTKPYNDSFSQNVQARPISYFHGSLFSFHKVMKVTFILFGLFSISKAEDFSIGINISSPTS